MTARALVIGGTGPTGPFIVEGLLKRGFEVAILNRGLHDVPEIPARVERIVGDPHFTETLTDALESRRFDVIIATYGRIRHVADVVTEHTDRLITIGGSPGMRGARFPDMVYPRGPQVPMPEDAPRVETPEEFHFGYLARVTEDRVMEHHEAGHYAATHLRYPIIYGPRQLRPAEWLVMRRVMDGRKYMVLPDGGLTVITRGYGPNMAHAVLLAVDQPEASAGQIYNCGDTVQLTLAQWTEVIVTTLQAELEIVSVPGKLAYPARDVMINRRDSCHNIFDVHKIRHELGYEDTVPVLEAVAATVRWFQANPPPESDEMRDNLALHYRTEDSMYEICIRAEAALAAVEHIDPDYRHPYAHPKKPGETGDHRGR